MQEGVVVAAVEALGFPYEILPCDPAYADTAEFCRHYGVPPENSGNTIVVESKRPVGRHAACVALATTRLDVNRTVRDLLGVKKLSFASPETTIEVTGMMIGGVTPFGLPEGLPIYVDERIMQLDYVILGGGSRSAKLRVQPEAVAAIAGARVVGGLAQPASGP